MANRLLLGNLGSGKFGLQVSKPGDDIITDTIATKDLLFNTDNVYRSGIIVSDTDVTSMTTSGVQLTTTEDLNGNDYIPAYQIVEKGVKNPVAYFIDDRAAGGSGYTFEADMKSGLPTNGGGGMYELSLGGSGSTMNLVKAAFANITYSETVGFGFSGTYPWFEDRTRSGTDGDVNILMLKIPCQYGKMTANTDLFGSSSVLTPTP